jgi:hypothetical protein
VEPGNIVEYKVQEKPRFAVSGGVLRLGGGRQSPQQMGGTVVLACVGVGAYYYLFAWVLQETIVPICLLYVRTTVSEGFWASGPRCDIGTDCVQTVVHNWQHILLIVRLQANQIPFYVSRVRFDCQQPQKYTLQALLQ